MTINHFPPFAKLVASSFQSIAKASQVRAEDIGLEAFVEQVLPQATGMEVLLKGEHLGNLMSLTAPVHQEPKQLYGLVNLAARAAWEASRAWCHGMGDDSHKAYDDLTTEEKALVRESVIGILQGNTPEQIHQAWLRRKVADGWSWGVEKDEARKEHPALLPYSELSPEQRVKNDIWRDTTQRMQKLYWTYPQ